MWQLKKPEPAKLIIGILATNSDFIDIACDAVAGQFGPIDLQSEIWPFTHTNYYENQTGQHILRKFVTLQSLIKPAQLAAVKHRTNRIERTRAKKAAKMNCQLPRPINLDPGIIEPSKLILASTKNFSHRIYIGKKMYAEVTLIYDKGKWTTLPYTYPDYKQQCYFDFFSKVRNRLLEQLKSKR